MQVLVKVAWFLNRFCVQYVGKVEIRSFENGKIKKIKEKGRVFICEMEAGVEKL